MSQEIFYRKVGKRYVPVQVHNNEFMDSFPKGSHLVVVNNGWNSRRYDIEPNHAALLAAALISEDHLAKAIQKASELRPEKQPLTKEQHDAWNRLSESLGEESTMLMWPSARMAAEETLKQLVKEADRALQNPMVRQAYDEFLMLAKLTLEEPNNDRSRP